MSVIAWDGKILACDRAANDGVNKWQVDKIWEINGKILACMGSVDNVHKVVSWFLDGATARYPVMSAMTHLIYLCPDRGMVRYNHTGTPVVHGSNLFAIGEGRDFAYGALALGHTAIEAVQAANKFSIFCDFGVLAYDTEAKAFRRD